MPLASETIEVRRTQVDAIEVTRVRMLPDGRMTRRDAARYLGREPKTLAMWALNGKGPRSVKVGGRVFYYHEDLDAFIRGRPFGRVKLKNPEV